VVVSSTKGVLIN